MHLHRLHDEYPELEDWEVDRVWRQARGDWSCASTEALARREGSWPWVVDSRVSALASALENLAEPLRHSFGVAAALGPRIDLKLWAALCPQADEACHIGLQLGLLLPQPLRFAHPQLSAALKIDPSLHQAAVEALEKSGILDLETLAAHLDAAGETHRAFPIAVDCARGLHRKGKCLRSRRMYRIVQRGWEESDERPRLALELGLLCLDLVELGESQRHLELALQLARRPAEEAGCHCALALHAHRSGNSTRMAVHLEKSQHCGTDLQPLWVCLSHSTISSCSLGDSEPIWPGMTAADSAVAMLIRGRRARAEVNLCQAREILSELGQALENLEHPWALAQYRHELACLNRDLGRLTRAIRHWKLNLSSGSIWRPRAIEGLNQIGQPQPILESPDHSGIYSARTVATRALQEGDFDAASAALAPWLGHPDSISGLVLTLTLAAHTKLFAPATRLDVFHRRCKEAGELLESVSPLANHSWLALKSLLATRLGQPGSLSLCQAVLEDARKGSSLWCRAYCLAVADVVGEAWGAQYDIDPAEQDILTNLSSLACPGYHGPATRTGVPGPDSAELAQMQIKVQRTSSELRAEMERLRVTLRSVGEGVVTTDPEGRVVTLNRSAEKLLNVTQKVARGAYIWDVFGPLRATGESPSLHSSLRPQQQLTTKMVVGGEVREISHVTAPLMDDEGHLVGLVLVLQDVTEARLRQNQKAEFLAIAGHEIRVPLTSIRAALQMLTIGRVDAHRQTQMLEIALRNSERLLRLVNDILETERLESGLVPISPRETDVAELVEQAYQDMRSWAQEAGLEICYETSPCSIVVDPDRLIQTLTNLLSNAIKFSKPGGTIWLRSSLQESTLLLTVSDAGRGIPADKLTAIFEKFAQVEPGDSKTRGGTGLGLAICRSIVEQHGGQIWAESEVGEGSTFFIRIPLKPMRPVDGAGIVQEGSAASLTDEQGSL